MFLSPLPFSLTQNPKKPGWDPPRKMVCSLTTSFCFPGTPGPDPGQLVGRDLQEQVP